MTRILCCFLATLAIAPLPAETRTISLARLRDKIEGGWAGQMIGVSYGAPTEFRHLNKIIDEKALPAWTPEKVSNALNQDDLYVDMTFAKVLADKGLDATTEDFGAMFRESRYRLWHANLAARRALRRGVSARLSGTPKYNAHANDIDFQIESDFIGLISPGLPQSVVDLSWRAGRVMNYGDGIYGGMFISCMYAAAFFESDPRRIVEAGLACLPPQSTYAQTVADLLAWSKASPDDWIAVWNRIEAKWNGRESCPAGAMHSFNIDAKLNGAYVALGVLYGKGDIGATIRVSTRCGQDSDCNPSSAAGIIGVVLGYNNIPDQWKSGIASIADRKFQYTDYSFKTIAETSVGLATQVVRRAGGRVEGGNLVIRTQTAKPAKLELWDDYGSPVEWIGAEDSRWTWTGSWNTESPDRRGRVRKTAGARGAEATVSFDGSGAIVTGPYLPTGGRLQVYLDGRLDRTVDVYSDEDSAKISESVWHAFDLRPGRHTLRIVVLGEPYGDSKGAEVAIEGLTVFRKGAERALRLPYGLRAEP